MSKKEFDINKVKIFYDFSQKDLPLLLIAYIEDDKIYILGSYTDGANIIGDKELRELWEIATNPELIIRKIKKGIDKAT